MSITQARTLIVKHHKYAWILTLTAVFIISGIYFRETVTYAATYYFQQSSWSGGVSVSTAAHSSNQNSGWNTYDSASSTLTVGGNIILTPVSSSFTDDGTLTTTGTASGGGFGNGTNSGTSVSGSGSAASVALGGASWTQTSNPSAGGDNAHAAVANGTDLYVAGREYVSATNHQWRIEKRDLTTGALITAFGTNGVVTADPSVYIDNITALAIDGTGLYVGGYDKSPGDSQWRIEKRDLTTGALITAFGTNGVVTVNPFTLSSDFAFDTLNALAVDGTGLYVGGRQRTGAAGGTNSYRLSAWRLEKRDLTTGALITGFGTSGVVTVDIQTGPDYGYDSINALAIDGTGLYAVGYTWLAGAYGRIEKRDLTTGALITGFGTNGVASNASVFFAGAALDGTGLYAGGQEGGNWRIEKRNPTTGALDTAFGTNGLVAVDPTVNEDAITALAIDSTGLYAGGYINFLCDCAGGEAVGTLSADGQWRIEKRALTTGALDTAFGTSGVLTYNPNITSGDNDWLRALVPVSGGIVAGGYGGGNSWTEDGDAGWRILRSRGADIGTFTSAIVDLGGASSFNTISWNATLNGQTITMKIRSDSSSNMSGATAWASCTTVSSGGSALDGGCVTNGHRYIQYQATFSTTNTSVTPTLNDITVNHSEYSPLGSLVSSKYNSESDVNIMGGLVWTEDATLPSGSTATFYLRTSATSDFSGSSWSTGINSSTSGCSKVGTTVTCTSTAVDSALRDGINDRWFQYKVTLTSLGGNTPTIDDIRTAYVVNSPPTFDTSFNTTGVLSVQNSTLGDADFGKVNISYRVGDIDTASFTPSFKYSVNGGSTWSDISANDLSASATSLKTYTGGATTTFSVVWNATSTLSASPVNIANAKIRVTANDGDAANNIGTADSAVTTLDTTLPEITSGNFVVDSSVDGAGSAGTPGDNRAGIKLYATDYSTIQYRLCNNNAFPSTDTQGNSCAWSALSASPISLATSSTQRITTGYPNAETVYVQVRDAYGNVTSGTASAPAMPANFDYKDVSNTAIDVYREFLSWSLFSPTDSSTFTGNSSGRYKVYHAVAADGSPAPASSTYSVAASLADPTVNYATHSITSATTSVHYYKVTAVNDQGSISDFTAVLSDIPNGSGGAVSLPPVISNTPTADTIRNTSARITFTTDSLATSTVEYGTTNSYGSTAYQTSFVQNHSLYLNSLSPNTAYYFRAKATNATGLDSNWAVGTTFTTAQGTVISGVTPMNVTDKTATIFWNTNASSTSKVYYGTGRSGSTLVGSVTVVGTSATTAGTNNLYQHQVGVPASGAFTAGNTYYYKVESTDGNSNTTTDDNNGQFYSFTTTLDTTAPTISGISAAVVGPTSAVIVWTTDEPATSQVRWSGTTGNHSKRTTTDMTFAGIPSYSVYHVATLSSQTQNIGEGGGTNVLVAQTPYYYTVVSADAAGNETESAEQTLTTTRTGEDVVVTVSRSLPQGADGPTADTTSPVIANMKVTDITPFTAMVTFDTSEGAVGKLAYSKDTSYGDHAADDFSWGTKHSIKIRGLTLGTEYHIKATVVDKAGNTGYSEEQTFKTSFLSENIKELAKIENIEQFQKEIEDTIESILPSLVPPFVSKPTITDITESGATISFRTNIKAFPLIGFVEDGTYDASKENPYSSEVSDTTEKATNHTLALLNLKSNTKYHVQARAFSLPQVVGKSEDLTFTTQASKIQSSIVETKRDSFTVVWITDEPTTSIVEYKDLSSGITQRKADERKTTSHSVKIENLPSGTSFDVNVSGLNEGGNLIEGGSTLHVTTSRDVTSPAISNFKVSNAMVPGRTDRIQTIISWTTDEPADSVVYYEEGIGTAGAEEKELANKSEVLDAYVMDHNIIISSLKPGAIYRIKVTSVDESGNLGVFGPRTIITPKQTESITDIIFKNFEDSFKFLRDM